MSTVIETARTSVEPSGAVPVNRIVWPPAVVVTGMMTFPEATPWALAVSVASRTGSDSRSTWTCVPAPKPPQDTSTDWPVDGVVSLTVHAEAAVVVGDAVVVVTPAPAVVVVFPLPGGTTIVDEVLEVFPGGTTTVDEVLDVLPVGAVVEVLDVLPVGAVVEVLLVELVVLLVVDDVVLDVVDEVLEVGGGAVVEVVDDVVDDVLEVGAEVLDVDEEVLELLDEVELLEEVDAEVEDVVEPRNSLHVVAVRR